ncbi:hypothetical protein [Lederbergia citrea]|uniref:Uncharacterized protein n=1 Tax=Lederbergia citrea TaxID=2833581 RepID=A0A942UMG9_9BACI|nr:hypothetical protein [Lederbergia citrea]MBS4224065.1 hypothetical protein [Lederbergia citrea]
MKKYFLIRILVVFLYIAVLWYGLKVQTNVGYIVIAVGMILGLVINYINYRVNFKGRMDQNKK